MAGCFVVVTGVGKYGTGLRLVWLRRGGESDEVKSIVERPFIVLDLEGPGSPWDPEARLLLRLPEGCSLLPVARCVALSIEAVSTASNVRRITNC